MTPFDGAPRRRWHVGAVVAIRSAWPGWHPMQTALSTDMNYLKPTLVSIMSVLEHASRNARVFVLGDNLGCQALAVLKRIETVHWNAEIPHSDHRRHAPGGVLRLGRLPAHHQILQVDPARSEARRAGRDALP